MKGMVIKMGKSFLVIGLGKFGISCAKTLSDMNYEVLGVDENLKLVNEMATYLTHTVQADSTDEDFLSSIGVKNFDACIVAIGDNQETSVMTTVLLKELGAKYIVAKAQSDIHAKILSKVGADRIVLPEKDMGIKLAHNLYSKNIYDMIDISPEYSIITIAASKHWLEKNLAELSPRDKHGVNIIAIESYDGTTNVFPTADTKIHPDDVLVVIGRNNDLEKLKKL